MSVLPLTIKRTIPSNPDHSVIYNSDQNTVLENFSEPVRVRIKFDRVTFVATADTQQIGSSKSKSISVGWDSRVSG